MSHPDSLTNRHRSVTRTIASYDVLGERADYKRLPSADFENSMWTGPHGCCDGITFGRNLGILGELQAEQTMEHSMTNISDLFGLDAIGSVNRFMMLVLLSLPKQAWLRALPRLRNGLRFVRYAGSGFRLDGRGPDRGRISRLGTNSPTTSQVVPIKAST